MSWPLGTTQRGRNTVRRQIGGKRRYVIHLKLEALYAEESGPIGPSDPEPLKVA